MVSAFGPSRQPSAEEVEAASPATPPDRLKQLARRRDEVVRGAVAANPAAPERLLASLAMDRAASVRLMVAANTRTPGESLDTLFETDSSDVEIVKKLARHPRASDLLRGKAQLALKSWRIELDSQGEVWPLVKRLATARDSSSSPLILDQLAGDDDPQVRLMVAANPSAPEETLVRLSLVEETQEAVAGNPSAPGDRLTALSSSTVAQVRAAVAGNPSTPPGTLTHRHLLGLSPPCAGTRARPSALLGRPTQ